MPMDKPPSEVFGTRKAQGLYTGFYCSEIKLRIHVTKISSQLVVISDSNNSTFVYNIASSYLSLHPMLHRSVWIRLNDRHVYE